MYNVPTTYPAHTYSISQSEIALRENKIANFLCETTFYTLATVYMKCRLDMLRKRIHDRKK